MLKTIVISLAALVGIAGAYWLVAANSGKTNSPGGKASPQELELLNVSYDPTRELWRDLNRRLYPASTSGRRGRD